MRAENNQGLAKIVVITCYFGELPWYLPFFLQSCAFNPTVDFLLAGDSLSDEGFPVNVRALHITLPQFRELAFQQLGLQINVEEPYKLCDLKPAYGTIFSDHIGVYDFWGHGDLDVIFGDIRGFITTEVLADHDVICVREEYVTGFFTLFRNVPHITELYRRSRDYEMVFTRPEHFCFDECNFAWVPLMEGLSIFDLQTPVESMTHVIKRLDAAGEIRAYFEFLVIEGLCGEMEWDRGRLLYQGRIEALLYHLIKFKKQEGLVIPDWGTVPEKYRIDVDRFRKVEN